MSVNHGETIYYSDLVNLVFTKIVNICQNIGHLDDIPNTLKKGNTITTGGITKSYNQNPSDWRYITTSGTAVGCPKNANSPIVVVSTSTISSEWNNFLVSRGISRKSNTVMTDKAILNFIANAAVFIKTKCVVVTNDYDDKSAIVYVSGNNTFPAVTPEINQTSETITRQNLKEMVNGLNNNLGYFQCYYEMGVNCSSSSSSSCSSSCSSSSSSSSSSSCWFIGFSDISKWL